LVSRFVEKEVRSVLGVGSPIDRNRGFVEMGMDSLTSLDLKKRLENQIGFPLPSTLTFTYPNIAALSGFLSDAILGVERKLSSPAKGKAAMAASSTVSDVALLRDEEVAASLLEELDRAGY